MSTPEDRQFGGPNSPLPALVSSPSADLAPLLPRRLQELVGTSSLPRPAVGGPSSANLLLDGVRGALHMPHAVTLFDPERGDKRKFVQLASGDEWSIRLEAIERGPQHASRLVPRQSIHAYAFHYGARLLIESSLEASTAEEVFSDAWGVWGVHRPLLPDFVTAWRRRFFFLLPDGFERAGESNFQSFSEGEAHERIRLGVVGLLASARPDLELTNASKDYWLDRGYTDVPPEQSSAVPEIGA